MKRLPYMNNKSYDQRLKLLNVPSLELRRLRRLRPTDLCYCYKILFGLTDVQSGVFFTPSLCSLLLPGDINTNCTKATIT